MDDNISCAGIVLAGGKSSRFGSPKALAEWNGKLFIERSIETLIPFTDTILVVTRDEMIGQLNRYKSDQVQVISDIARFKGKGPLAGFYSAMIRKKADFYIVSPCDMPLMDSVMYKKWLKFAEENDYDCVIPILNKKIYPLNGVYKKSCLPEIASCLRNNNYKVLKLLDRKNTFYMEVTKNEAAYFKNVNTPEELLALKGGTENGKQI